MPGSVVVRARSTMKALRKTEAGRGLVLETVPVPHVGPTDVLVRVKAASICGTHLHVYNWDDWSQQRVRPPLTLGHEFCGTVEHTGEEVTEFGRGDRVSAEMHLDCGRCVQCRLREAHICQNLRIIGIDRDGAFAEFVKIPARNVWKLDVAIPESTGPSSTLWETQFTPFLLVRLRGGRCWSRDAGQSA
jgi:threonine 3-dehydrogenase